MDLPIESESRVSTVNGKAVVMLDHRTEAMSGIATTPVKGAAVPYSGVVWLEGKAWAYVEQEPGRFVRSEVVPAPEPDDLRFLLKTPVHDAQVVRTGAQLLLSEEFRSQIQVGETH